MRRSFSLVEVVVAMTISLVVFGGLWGLFRLSERSFHATRKRLTSLQGAYLLSERLGVELRSAVTDQRVAPQEFSGRGVEYLYVDSVASDLSPGTLNPTLVVRSMRYRHCVETGVFYRKDGPALERSFGLSRFECVLFYVPEDATEHAFRNYISVRITCASEDDLEFNLGVGDRHPDRRDTHVVTLITSIGLHEAASRKAFPWWVANRLPQVAY